MSTESFGDLPTFFGDYVIEDELGRGGMKIVARAYHAPSERKVALALLKVRFPDLELKERFFREATAMQSLKHPHIAEVYDCDTQDGHPYFAMEFIDGSSLSDLILAEGMPPGEVAALMQPVCMAVAYAHEQGVLHRDLKPDNILLDADRVPKLIDFGLAKLLHDDLDLTRSGQGLGTRLYASPEQRQGDINNVSEASDVYCLGMTILEMLVGRTRFLDLCQDSIPYPTLQADLLSQRGIVLSPDWLELCQRCLHPEPSMRYPSVDGLVSDLEALVQPERRSDDEVTDVADHETEIATEPGPHVESTWNSARPGSVIAQRYTLEVKLGQGGMGEVWRAKASHRPRPVVIKFLPESLRNNPTEMKRLRESFELVESLHHGNVCPIYDLDEDPIAGVFLVMMYVDGIDLSQFLQRRRDAADPFSPMEVCRILDPIARAIDHAHEAGVLHRDIKPDNIMLAEEGERPMLVDFGLAEAAQSTMTKVEMDRSLSGTLRYLAPESWQGQVPRRASDQYALATVAYEMLSGQMPFGGCPNSEALRQCVLHEPVPALNNVSAAINEVFRQALAKKPRERFANCEAFLSALRACQQPTVMERETPSLSVPFLSAPGVIALLVVALGGGIGAFQWMAKQEVAKAPPVPPVEQSGGNGETPEKKTPEEDPEKLQGPNNGDSTTGDGLGNDEDSTTDPQDKTTDPPGAETKTEPKREKVESTPPPSPAQLAEDAYQRGLELNRQKEYERAILELDEAIRWDSEHHKAHYARAFAKVRLGGEQQLDSALGDLDEAIRIDENYFKAYIERGDANRMLAQIYQSRDDDRYTDRAQKSIDAYQTALVLKPNAPLALHGKALTDWLVGAYGQAINGLTLAIKQQPTADRLEDRGNLYIEREDYLRAAADFEAALEHDDSRTHLAAKIQECQQAVNDAQQ